MEDNHVNLQQAMQSFNSEKWIEATQDEMKSIRDNDVWDLI